MRAKLKASAAGPIPAALTPVLSLRDVDGRDIEPGLYVIGIGKYVIGKTRDGVPIGDVVPVSIPDAFDHFQSLRAKVRPGMDVATDAQAGFLAAVKAWTDVALRLLEEIGKRIGVATEARQTPGKKAKSKAVPQAELGRLVPSEAINRILARNLSSPLVAHLGTDRNGGGR